MKNEKPYLLVKWKPLNDINGVLVDSKLSYTVFKRIRRKKYQRYMLYYDDMLISCKDDGEVSYLKSIIAVEFVEEYKFLTYEEIMIEHPEWFFN